jgi:hypothetical protein
MRHEGIVRSDARAHHLFRALWLGLGCLVSFLYLGSALIDAIYPMGGLSWREMVFTTKPLDICFALCVLSTAGVFIMTHRETRLCRATFVIGWAHACSLLYFAMCTAFIAQALFLRAHGIPWAISQTPTSELRDLSFDHVQTVFSGMTRGFATYFVGVSGLYLGCSDRKGLALPAVEFYCLLFYFLWLALQLGSGMYH